MEYKQKRYSTHALFNNQFIYKYIYIHHKLQSNQWMNENPSQSEKWNKKMRG